MGGIFTTAFLCTAIAGFLFGYFIPPIVLLLVFWPNFLALVVMISAWDKADEGFTVSVLMTCIVFWLFTYGGRMMSLV